ncbi:MAG: HDOD domain-containing protein, partial [Sandaracinaceae bacterium]|nr:HDOD domain-containing protein [Sandaracinaceae bacterium]
PSRRAPLTWWQSLLAALGLRAQPSSLPPPSAARGSESGAGSPLPDVVVYAALPGWREREALRVEPDRAARALASKIVEDTRSRTEPAERRFLERLAAQVLSGELDLPIFPDSAQRLDAMLRQGDPPLDDVIAVVEGDPVLARRVLQRASSAAYGRTMTDLRQAIVRIGLDVLWQVSMSAVLNAPVFRVRGMEDEARTVRRLSMLAGSLALELCEEPASRGEHFLAGLLHDLGSLQIMRVAVAARDAAPAPSGVASAIAHHGAGVGLLVARAWAMPQSVQIAIGGHPAPVTAIELAVRRAQLVAQSVLGPTVLDETGLTAALSELGGSPLEVATLRRRAETWASQGLGDE